MNVTLPRRDIPIDAAGNVASRDMYRWMSDMTARVGGTTGALPSASETFDDAGIAEGQAVFYKFADDVGQTPVVQELLHLVEVQTDQIAELAALVSEMAKFINGLGQGTLQ